jgi:hypothetical protein
MKSATFLADAPAGKKGPEQQGPLGGTPASYHNFHFDLWQREQINSDN